MIKISQIWPVGATAGWPLGHFDISPPFLEHLLTSRLWGPHWVRVLGASSGLQSFSDGTQGTVGSAGGWGTGEPIAPVTGVLSSVMICLISCPYCCQSPQPRLPGKAPATAAGGSSGSSSTWHKPPPRVRLTPRRPGEEVRSLGLLRLLLPGPLLERAHSGIPIKSFSPGNARSPAHVSLVPASLSWNLSKCPCSSGTVALAAPSSPQDLDGAWLTGQPP